MCKIDGEDGKLTILERYSGVVEGNYIALAPDQASLLVTSKNSTKDQGGLVQYSILEDGNLSYVTEKLKAGDLPCYVSITPDSEYVLSANYADDQISLYSYSNSLLSSEIDNIIKPDQSKGHFIKTDPSGKFVHAVFLGLDKVLNYKIENNAFVENPDQPSFSLPNGFGPRHMIFHPDRDFVYILNETHSSVTACSYNPGIGILNEIQNISMLPVGFSETNNAAAIRIHPNGNFLYASNRGHNSIAVYRILEDGSLQLVELETAAINFPRDFNISPDGKYMIICNQKGSTVISMAIDKSTGELTNTGKFIMMSKPLAIEFLPRSGNPIAGFRLGSISQQEQIEVFPNPAHGIINVSISSDSRIQELGIFNLNGQQLKDISPTKMGDIDVADLTEGLYFLRGKTLTNIIQRVIIIY